jgi:hypothetical protein
VRVTRSDALALTVAVAATGVFGAVVGGAGCWAAAVPPTVMAVLSTPRPATARAREDMDLIEDPPSLSDGAYEVS